MRDLIVPLMVITPVLVGFAGARVLLWPDSLPLRMALEIGYRIILLDGRGCAAARTPGALGAGPLGCWLCALPFAASVLVAFHRSDCPAAAFAIAEIAAWFEHVARCVR